MRSSIGLCFVVLGIAACSVPAGEEGQSTTSSISLSKPIPVDAAGWSVLEKSADAQVIHVSSSAGDDDNDGLTESTPVKTIARGRSLLRNGKPDWLVFKRGDVFTAPIASVSNGWDRSGRSATEPMVLGAYGTGERPRFETKDSVFTTTGGAPLHDIAIVGLHFEAKGRTFETPSDGIYWNRPGKNILIEDCLIDGYRKNVVVQNYGKAIGSIESVAVRRNVLVDAWGNGNPQGLYIDQISGMWLEENIFDHNGWNEETHAGRTQYNHNAYMQASVENTYARSNFFLRGSSYGLESKGGKRNDVVDNVFSGNAQGIQWGSSRVGIKPNAEGATGSITGNVILHSVDISTGNRQGHGIDVGNAAAPGVTVADNIVAHCNSGDLYGHAFFVEGNLPDSKVGIKRATFEHNTVVDWPSAMQVQGTQTEALVVRNNIFEDATPRAKAQPAVWLASGVRPGYSFEGNQVFHAAPSNRWFLIGQTYADLATFKDRTDDVTSANARVAFHDASRDLDSYAKSIGLDGEAPFYAALRQQSHAHWDPKLTVSAALAYLREGYAP